MNHKPWALLHELYVHKRNYYNGNPKITDAEYDRIESSLIAIGGEEWFREWNCVGFDKNMHELVLLEMSKEMDRMMEEHKK